MSQFYERLYDYIHEYQKLVYDYYSKDAISFLVTYYFLNQIETVWDNENMMDGPYERIGELSGVKYNKIYYLPIFLSDEISTNFDANELGVTKENMTSFVIPSTYNFTPHPGDFVKLEQEYLRPTNDKYPLFVVTGAEITTNTDKRHWKLKIETEQSRTTDELDLQVNNEYYFFEYTKNIYEKETFEFLNILMEKNKKLKELLKLEYDQNSGAYFI